MSSPRLSLVLLGTLILCCLHSQTSANPLVKRYILIDNVDPPNYINYEEEIPVDVELVTDFVDDEDEDDKGIEPDIEEVIKDGEVVEDKDDNEVEDVENNDDNEVEDDSKVEDKDDEFEDDEFEVHELDDYEFDDEIEDTDDDVENKDDDVEDKDNDVEDKDDDVEDKDDDVEDKDDEVEGKDIDEIESKDSEEAENDFKDNVEIIVAAEDDDDDSDKTSDDGLFILEAEEDMNPFDDLHPLPHDVNEIPEEVPNKNFLHRAYHKVKNYFSGLLS